MPFSIFRLGLKGSGRLPFVLLEPHYPCEQSWASPLEKESSCEAEMNHSS